MRETVEETGSGFMDSTFQTLSPLSPPLSRVVGRCATKSKNRASSRLGGRQKTCLHLIVCARKSEAVICENNLQANDRGIRSTQPRKDRFYCFCRRAWGDEVGKAFSLFDCFVTHDRPWDSRALTRASPIGLPLPFISGMATTP